MNLEKEKRVMVLAAKRADKLLLKYFDRKVLVQEKSNNSLVSKADLESNNVIVNTIKENFSHHNIMTEEASFHDMNSEFKWVIDPLDGTHNYINGAHIWGTSIALEYKHKPILGLLNFPFLKLTALAEKGKGAYLNGKRIRVSKKSDLAHAFVMFEFSYPSREKMIRFFNKFVDTRVDIRNFGSAVYDLMMVAAGKADAFTIYTTNEWDIAAGFLLIEEAGGKITDINGKPYDLTQGNFLASNGKIHNKVLNQLK